MMMLSSLKWAGQPIRIQGKVVMNACPLISLMSEVHGVEIASLWRRLEKLFDPPA